MKPPCSLTAPNVVQMSCLLTLRLAHRGSTFHSQLLGLRRRQEQLPEGCGGGAPPSGPPAVGGGCRLGEGHTPLPAPVLAP